MAVRFDLKWFSLKEKINKPLTKFQLMRSTSSSMNSTANWRYFSDLWWLTARGLKQEVLPVMWRPSPTINTTDSIMRVHVKLWCYDEKKKRQGKHLNGFSNVMLVFIEINVRNRGNNRAMLNQMAILVLYFKMFQSAVCLIQAASSSAWECLL